MGVCKHRRLALASALPRVLLMVLLGCAGETGQQLRGALLLTCEVGLQV